MSMTHMFFIPMMAAVIVLIIGMQVKSYWADTVACYTYTSLCIVTAWMMVGTFSVTATVIGALVGYAFFFLLTGAMELCSELFLLDDDEVNQPASSGM